MTTDTFTKTQAIPGTDRPGGGNALRPTKSALSGGENQNYDSDKSTSKKPCKNPKVVSFADSVLEPKSSKAYRRQRRDKTPAPPYGRFIIAAALVSVICILLPLLQPLLRPPYSEIKTTPESNFVVVIDAGSTGSRVHVYEFNTTSTEQAGIPQLLHETFELIRPGLSHESFILDFKEGAKSLDPLLKTALQVVPEHLYRSTPITLKATAGLRLIGEETSVRYIKYIENYLRETFPFQIKSVGIMEGKEEAVYAWLTTNYLLGYLDDDSATDTAPTAPTKRNHKLTAAVFDLGGASTQIVFEPDPALYSEPVIQEIVHAGHGDHIYDLTLGGYRYNLYQHSHLGYGLMEARKKIHQTVFSNYVEAVATRSRFDLPHHNIDEFLLGTNGPIFHMENPCIGTGMNRTVRVPLRTVLREKLRRQEDVDNIDYYIRSLREMGLIEEDVVTTVSSDDDTHHGPSENLLVTMVGPKVPQPPEECIDIALQILNLDVQCRFDPCSFNGVHQPDISETFAQRKKPNGEDAPLYMFSYFYDRTYPLGLPSKFPVSEFLPLLKDVCLGPQAWSRNRDTHDGPVNPRFEKLSSDVIEELDGRPEWCLDLSVMYSMLHKGYGIPLDRQITIAKKIHDHELGWCLGAAIGLLGQLEEEKDV